MRSSKRGRMPETKANPPSAARGRGNVEHPSDHLDRGADHRARRARARAWHFVAGGRLRRKMTPSAAGESSGFSAITPPHKDHGDQARSKQRRAGGFWDADGSADNVKRAEGLARTTKWRILYETSDT